IATKDLNSALIYANLYYFFAAAIPVLLLYFSIYFRRERPLGLKHVTFIVPWIILCFHFLLDNNIVIKEVFFDSAGNKDVELNLFFYVLYVIYFVFYFLSTYVFLF